MPQQTIENNLERIADAVEKMAKHLSHLGRLSGIEVGGVTENVTEDPAEETAAEQKARLKAEKAAKKKAAKAAAEAAVDEDEDDEDDDDEDADEEVITKAKIKAALQTFMSSEGKEKAIAILKKHGKGAENLSQLKEKFFGRVMEALGDTDEDDDDDDDDD